MFKRRNSESSGTAGANARSSVVVEASEACRGIAREMSGRYWPASVVVQMAHSVPVPGFEPGEFARVIGILIRCALTSMVHSGGPHAIVSASEVGRVAMFSVRSIAVDAFWKGEAPPVGDGSLLEARAIVAGHGGHLWVDDSVGAGSTVFFTVPLSRVRAA